MYKLTYVVPKADNGRLLKRVARSSMNVSARLLASSKASGAITVNGEQRNADRPVYTGDTIEIIMKDDGETVAPDDAPVDIVYMDDDLIVINKPAPLPSISSPKQPSNTLENRMAYYFRNEPGYIYRPVNRLDKGTSGLMIVARHAHAQNLLQEMLHSDQFIRTYLAVAEGEVVPPEGRIDLPIGKEPGASVRRIVDPQNGKPSSTIYRTLEAGKGRSLVELRLLTGRTHQIRVHLSAIGHPVVGDFLYGSETDELPGRFALHSHSIELTHPMTGQKLSFCAELPEELKKLI